MENNNGLKPFTLKQSMKFGLFIFLSGIVLFVIFLLIIIGGISGFKELTATKGVNEVMKPMIYGFILFAFIVSLGILIGYKKRKNKAYTEKILTLQSPLMVMTLKGFGISFNELKAKEFYFYYNLLFGIFLILFGFILFFVLNDYKIGLIPFSFGIINIVWGSIKRN